MEIVFARICNGKVTKQVGTDMRFITDHLNNDVGYAAREPWHDGFLLILGTNAPGEKGRFCHPAKDTYIVIKVVDNHYISLTEDEIREIKRRFNEKTQAHTTRVAV